MADTPPGGPPPPPAPAVPSSDAAAPRMPLRRLGWRRVLALAGVVLLIAACAVYMLYTLGSNLGLDALLVGVTAAILPVPVLVACFLWLDRYEPEPLKLPDLLLRLGRVRRDRRVADRQHQLRRRCSRTRAARRAGRGAGGAVHRGVDQGARPDPAVLIFRRREWSGITDGLVYCGLSAVGFAMVENILYLGGLRLRLGRRPVRAGHRRPQRHRHLHRRGSSSPASPTRCSPR